MKGTHAQHQLLNRRGAMVHHVVQALLRTPVPTATKTLTRPSWTSAGIFTALAAATLITATPHSAGAYTQGSADYGAIITGLQTVSAGLTQQDKLLTDASGNSVFLNTGGNGTWGHDTSYLNTINQAFHEDLWLGSMASTTTPTGVFDTALDTYLAPPTSNDGPGTIGGINGPSTFQWNPYLPTPDAQTAFQNVQSGTTQAYWSVFNDQYGQSVFESPNGNSYLDWYPQQAQSLQTGTNTGTTIQFQNAIANTDAYGVFKDAYGGSVFTDPQGFSYFTGIKYGDTTSPYLTSQESPYYANAGIVTNENRRQGSVFTDAAGNGVFTYTSYNPTNGSIGLTGSLYEPTESVFIGGTGAHAAQGGSPGPRGSVFITDDPTNTNVGNSVFLDPYGNSYLDDITNSLTLPSTIITNNYNESGAQKQPTWSYTNNGNLTLWQPDGLDNYGNDSQPLTLTEMLALALGEAPFANYGSSTAGTQYYSFSYPWLSSVTMLMPQEWDPSAWYTSIPGMNGNYSNMFAQAFFNPPTSGATSLVPYLAFFGGYNPNSSEEQAMQANATAAWDAVPDQIVKTGIQDNALAPNENENPWTISPPSSSGWAASGIDYTKVTYPVLQAVGDTSGGSQIYTETQATAALLALYDNYGLGNPTPPSNPTGAGPNAYVSPNGLNNAALGEQVPYAMATSVLNAAAWWQASEGWFITFFSTMWILYTTIASFKWLNWGLHGGSFPLRVMMRQEMRETTPNPLAPYNGKEPPAAAMAADA